MANNILVYNNSLGDAGNASPQLVSTVTAAKSVPLMLNSQQLVPNDGTAPIVGYAPIGGVAPGQAFTPQGLEIVNVDASAPYTAGSDYYMQASGTLGTAATAHYAGTAISATTLAYSKELAATVAAANAPPLPPANGIVETAPASATNQLLTENSLRNKPSVPGVINTATGAAGTISYRIKANGIYFSLALSALPLTDFTDILATFPLLPAGVAEYLQQSFSFTNENGQIGGIVLNIDNTMRLLRTATIASTQANAQGFVQYG